MFFTLASLLGTLAQEKCCSSCMLFFLFVAQRSSFLSIYMGRFSFEKLLGKGTETFLWNCPGIGLLRAKWADQTGVILPSLQPGGWSAWGQPQAGGPKRFQTHVRYRTVFNTDIWHSRWRNQIFHFFQWKMHCLQDQIHGHLKALNDSTARDFIGFGRNLFMRTEYYKLEIGSGGQIRKQISMKDCHLELQCMIKNVQTFGKLL